MHVLHLWPLTSPATEHQGPNQVDRDGPPSPGDGSPTLLVTDPSGPRRGLLECNGGDRGTEQGDEETRTSMKSSEVYSGPNPSPYLHDGLSRRPASTLLVQIDPPRDSENPLTNKDVWGPIRPVLLNIGGLRQSVVGP